MASPELLLHIGKRIRQIRQQKNISQEELADLSGLDRTYIGGIERGTRNVSVLNLDKICIALGARLADLFNEIPEKQ